ncbi:MAG: GNAT family N-acetyltransferase [Bacteroidetes bacterium]|nr:GNAT family N-acetyltransferase [Bacteroidota bacterium]
MNSIINSTIHDAEELAKIGRQSFIESHGHSASVEDITAYVNSKFTSFAFVDELSEPRNIYHHIKRDGQLIGYSKIILSCISENIVNENVTKLDRLYLIQEFHSLKLGQALLEYNIQLSNHNNQKGMWLYVWKENTRAVQFYLRNGFQIIGAFDFKISENHSNPNYHLFLEF